MQTVTSLDGTRIAFDKSGEGAPVIFVGPSLADRSAGAPLMALLAAHFTALNYDRRGRGNSGDTEPYAIEREIEDLAAVIEAAGGSAFVVGGSSGGVLALDAASRGVGIKRLALYEPPLKIDASSAPVPTDYVQELSALVNENRRGDAVEYYMNRDDGRTRGTRGGYATGDVLEELGGARPHARL